MKVSAPQPGSQVLELGYFAATWVVQGTIPPGPWGAGGEFGWTDSTEWLSGRFFVVGQWNFQMPSELSGDGPETLVMGYDTDLRLYTFDAFSKRRHVTSTGVLGKRGYGAAKPRTTGKSFSRR